MNTKNRQSCKNYSAVDSLTPSSQFEKIISEVVTIDIYSRWMTFTPDEIEKWHNDRRAASDKIEADRLHAHQRARRASATATCVHCGNPFGISEGHISDDLEICYVCLD